MNEHSMAQLRNAVTPTLTPTRGGLLQRACACGQHTKGGECEGCKKKGLELQRSPLYRQGMGDRSEGQYAPPIVHEVLRSSGQPLDPTARQLVEPHFERDFSSVRVHTGARAAESAQAVGALAYTVGKDIVFGAGHMTTWSATVGSPLKRAVPSLSSKVRRISARSPRVTMLSPLTLTGRS